MIVVATADFEVYHDVVAELRDRSVRFTTVEVGDDLPDDAAVVIAGRDDDLDYDVETVRADPDNPRRAVEEALAVLRGGEGRTVVGIDPGPEPGVAVLTGGLVTAVFQPSAADAADIVRREVADEPDPLVRIGDGARLQGARIVDALEDVPVELVDETGTTPYQGRGVRNAGDVVAAINIARLEGDPVDERDVEPTAGELQVIKERSREASAADRTITQELARRVAVGELTLEEALDEHRAE